MKIELSEIKQVSVKDLKPNEINEHYFRPETGSYFEKLAEDVKKRGIQVPLIAKKDGTLLAGHNRLIVAKNIKLKTVPVQYVQNDLTEKEERAYIIKDNVLRRHLSPAERRSLYQLIIPDFEERVKIKNSKEFGVSVPELAEASGLNPKSIGCDIARIRRQKEQERIEKSPVDLANEKAINNYKKAVAAMLNLSVLGSKVTLEEFIRITKEALNNLEGTHTKFEVKAEVEKKPKVRTLK